MYIKLIELALVEICEVANRAQSGVSCLVLLHGSRRALLEFQMLLNVVQVDLLVLKVIIDTEILDVLTTVEAKVFK